MSAARLEAIDRRIDEARGLAERALSRIRGGGTVIDVVVFERHATEQQILTSRRTKCRLASLVKL